MSPPVSAGAETAGPEEADAGDHNASTSVLHVAVPAPVGGLETVLRGLALGHHRRGLDVGVILVVEPSGSGLNLAEDLRSEGLSVETLELPPRSYLQERRGVDQAVREFRPDVLHTHGYRPDILDAGLARKHGLGLVTTVHGSSRMGGLSRLFELVQLYVLRRFDAVVAVSDALGRELRNTGLPDDTVHVIPNGLYPEIDFLSRTEAREELGLDAAVKAIGWLGRLIPAKGPDQFLEALSQLDLGGVVASVIGDGPMRADLQSRAEDLGIEHRMRFHGRLENAARYLKAFDVFALSSRTEGTPMVLLEAMAAEIPIVCSRVGGVPEVVDEDAAWRVPKGRPDLLAEKMARALHSPAAARVRARAARQRFESEYSGDLWLSRYRDLYEKVRASTTD